MKTLMLAVAATAVWGGLGAQSARASETVAGVVIDVKGSPKVRSEGKSALKALKLNKFVYEGDIVTTGSTDKAAIALVGGAEVRINRDSEFVMESGGGRKASSIYSRAGQAWTRMLHGKAGMNVRSPLAVAAVRGTEADVDITDQMTVKVYEGHVDLMNEHGKTPLTQGMMSQVTGAGQAPQRGRSMTAADQGTWQNGMSPQNLNDNLKRLQQKAERTRSIRLKYMADGKAKELNLKLEKK